ncbi:UNVERIFIED_ORG: hypothetical protein [Escherichia phage CMSTMSU]
MIYCDAEPSTEVGTTITLKPVLKLMIPIATIQTQTAMRFVYENIQH